MNEITDTTALVPAEPAKIVALFASEDAIDQMVAKIEAEARSHVPDTSTNKGRKAITSLAYKVTRSKTALDSAGKDLNAEARRQIDAVDAQRRKIRDRLDALRDEVTKPLTEWEEKEAAERAAQQEADRQAREERAAKEREQRIAREEAEAAERAEREAEERRAREEAERKAKEEAEWVAAERAKADAARYQYAVAEASMALADLNTRSGGTVLSAIIGGKIPHVTFRIGENA